VEGATGRAQKTPHYRIFVGQFERSAQQLDGSGDSSSGFACIDNSHVVSEEAVAKLTINESNMRRRLIF
jgi:hypothetical protein